MKVTNIAKVCSAKIEALCNSIDDEKVAKLVKRDAIITGGAIASMLLKEPVNDFDIYFKTKETVLAVAIYFVDKFHNDNPGFVKKDILIRDYAENGSDTVNGFPEPHREDGVEVFIRSSGFIKGKKPELIEVEDFEDPTKTRMIDPKFYVRGMSSNAITLSNKTQLILRFYGSPSEIHENYDFIHTTNYWTQSDGVVTNLKALEALMARTLVYQGSKYPVSSLIRTRKFIKRGYSIDAGQYLKMALQVSLLDLTDINTLKDQLTGVDSAYFSIIIKACEDNLIKDQSWQIDHSYIVSIIDKVFN